MTGHSPSPQPQLLIRSPPQKHCPMNKDATLFIMRGMGRWIFQALLNSESDNQGTRAVQVGTSNPTQESSDHLDSLQWANS